MSHQSSGLIKLFYPLAIGMLERAGFSSFKVSLDFANIKHKEKLWSIRLTGESIDSFETVYVTHRIPDHLASQLTIPNITHIIDDLIKQMQGELKNENTD